MKSLLKSFEEEEMDYMSAGRSVDRVIDRMMSNRTTNPVKLGTLGDSYNTEVATAQWQKSFKEIYVSVAGYTNDTDDKDSRLFYEGYVTYSDRDTDKFKRDFSDYDKRSIDELLLQKVPTEEVEKYNRFMSIDRQLSSLQWDLPEPHNDNGDFLNDLEKGISDLTRDFDRASDSERAEDTWMKRAEGILASAKKSYSSSSGRGNSRVIDDYNKLVDEYNKLNDDIIKLRKDRGVKDSEVYPRFYATKENSPKLSIYDLGDYKRYEL